jgi:hypothetical protein
MIDYMFRPFFIRPSSDLAWRSKEEQCSSVRCKVHYGLNLGFVENEISFRQGGGEKSPIPRQLKWTRSSVKGQLKCDGTRAETRFRLSAKRTSTFKSAGASVQLTTGSRGVRISGSNARDAGYTMFLGNIKSTGYPLHSTVSPSLPLPASLCAITFQLEYTTQTSSLFPRVLRLVPP